MSHSRIEEKEWAGRWKEFAAAGEEKGAAWKQASRQVSEEMQTAAHAQRWLERHERAARLGTYDTAEKNVANGMAFCPLCRMELHSNNYKRHVNSCDGVLRTPKVVPQKCLGCNLYFNFLGSHTPRCKGIHKAPSPPAPQPASQPANPASRASHPIRPTRSQPGSQPVDPASPASQHSWPSPVRQPNQPSPTPGRMDIRYYQDTMLFNQG